MKTTFIRRASVVLAAFTMACGDSTGPSSMSEQEVFDMLDAMSAVAAFEDIPGAPTTLPALRLAPTTANATATVSSNVDCPNGGSASFNGSVVDDEAGHVTAQVTTGFASCAAPSSEGRVWTFNGNIVDNLDATFNETTGAFSMTASRVGGLSISSDVASGSCQVNVTFTMSGDDNSLQGSISGSVCGKNIQQSFEFTN